MKIEKLKSEIVQGKSKVSATVTWEDCDRPATDVYFETDAEFADSLTCNPDAFLVGCLIPALHHGEKRVFINEEICPELRDGLITAMNLIRHWYYGSERDLVRIEARTRGKSLTPEKPERAGFFFSGGIDSYATLRRNRLNFPPEHPRYIKDGLVVFGLHEEEPDTFKQVLGGAVKIAPEAGIIPIPVETNIVSLDQGGDFWTNEFQSAALASVGHAFAKRFSVISIAASDSIPGLSFLKQRHLKPLGSHPLLDPQYSSSDLRVRHDGITLTRLDKTRLVVDWDLAFQNVRVCNNTKSISPEILNCGKCEKCVRTMLALLSLGALEKSCAFPSKEVTEELVTEVGLPPPATGDMDYYGVLQDYLELLEPLARAGRHDLVCAIRRRKTEFLTRQNLMRWKDRIRRFDHEYLSDEMVKIKRLVLQKAGRAAVN